IRALHKVNLRGKTDEDWLKYHKQYINIWEHRYDFLPICEPIVAWELVTDSEYMPWLRHHGKPYLLPKEAKGRQRSPRRPQRSNQNLRCGIGAKMSSSSAPTQ
ncbi:hypothetical protein Gogos_010420, partial [Gossypium gossypioides]|nr:hypothetical protein [Gossypium gossypioides]